MNIGYRRLLPGRLRRWMRSLVVECGDLSCRGFHVSNALLRQPGIFLDLTWYCSSDCLRDGIKQRVEAQLSSALTDLRRPPRMPFRLILLAGGLVSEAQLAEARAMQASNTRTVGGAGAPDVGSTLVSLGYVTEEQVGAARAAEAGCPFFGGAIQAMLPAYRLPAALVQLHCALPVHYSPVTDRLVVGFVYRVNNSLVQAIEQVIGCRVEACMITATAWKQHVAAIPPPCPEQVGRQTLQQSRIVDMIVEQAIASGADRIRMGLAGTSFWVRLTAGPRSEDLLIDLAEDGAQAESGFGSPEPVSKGA
jgi:hypothetical protein